MSRRKRQKTTEPDPLHLDRCARCGSWPWAAGYDLDEDWWSLVQQELPYYFKNCAPPRLQAHHIKARQDGGDNRRENLIPLCNFCHKEWHDREAVIPFRQWLGTMPKRWIERITESYFSSDPPDWIAGTTFDEAMAWLKGQIFEAPSLRWFRDRRDAFLDRHEQLYGGQSHYHLKDPEDQIPKQLVLDLSI